MRSTRRRRSNIRPWSRRISGHTGRRRSKKLYSFLVNRAFADNPFVVRRAPRRENPVVLGCTAAHALRWWPIRQLLAPTLKSTNQIRTLPVAVLTRPIKGITVKQYDGLSYAVL